MNNGKTGDEREFGEEEFTEKPKPFSGFVQFCVVTEIIILVLYALFVKYPGADISPVPDPDNLDVKIDPDHPSTMHLYPMFQDVHVMIFIGFGFLMTFLKKYGYSSVGYNFLVSAFAIQWGILVDGFFHSAFAGHWDFIELNVASLVVGDFAAGAVLISFGAVLGIVSPKQLLGMALFEIVFYSINEKINVMLLGITDVGGSMIIHTFGAYFGLAVSWALTHDRDTKIDDAAPSYTSNLFSMIGTIFLWMYWPSFNGALAGEAYFKQERAVINTVLSLTASCMAAFTVSKAAHSKFKMEDIQNATLAGGVAVGASADLVIHPWGAILTGLCAGSVSTLGFAFLSDVLSDRLNIHDTCGVHNLHGMPGIIGGLGAVVATGVASKEYYGENLDVIFANPPGLQAAHQFSALLITLGISCATGLGTGFLLKTRLFRQEKNTFSDNASFVVPKGMEISEANAAAIFGSRPGQGGSSFSGMFPRTPPPKRHAVVPTVQDNENEIELSGHDGKQGGGSNYSSADEDTRLK